MENGLVYVFTGDGKGKTSAALGVATRSLLIGEQVKWVSFYKQESWGIAESKLKAKFSNIEMSFSGKGFKIGKKTAKVGTKGHVVLDTATEDEHQKAASYGLKLVRQSLESKPFLLVMDEALNAISDGLIDEKDILEVLRNRDRTHVILTGRGASKILIKFADLVTECKKIKHPYDEGKLAIRGLDF